MSLYQRLFYQKAKNSAEYQEARWQSKRKHLLKKKQQQEEWRRAKEGTSEEQPKDMRKYKKDLNDAFIVFWQFVVLLAYCFMKDRNNSF